MVPCEWCHGAVCTVPCARTSSAVSIMSIRLSTPQPPSGSISFSLARTGRARAPAATPPRASVDGAQKESEDDASESMLKSSLEVSEKSTSGLF